MGKKGRIKGKVWMEKKKGKEAWREEEMNVLCMTIVWTRMQ
jgi:hypothetical protein